MKEIDEIVDRQLVAALNDNQRLRNIISKLIVKVNGVTVFHRHGNPIPKRKLDDLSNYQLEVEREVTIGDINGEI